MSRLPRSPALIAVPERIGDRRRRLVLPSTRVQASLDVIEAVPA